MFVVPALIYMLLFVGYPIISNMILSFQDVTVETLKADVKPFIGFDNYIALFKDGIIWTALINTLIFTVSCIIFQFVIGFALALLLSRRFSFAKSIRGLSLIPWMIPITITALIFKFIFSTDVGILNNALTGLGVTTKNIDWLTSGNTAMIALIITNIWIGIPFNMILLSAGLTTIPTELYESAAIDGASKRQTFFKITLPLLKPTISAVLILGFIYTFKVFDLVYVMTGGGPVNSTQVLSTYSYKLSFSMFEYSKGAAVANVLFIVLFIASLVYLKFAYKEEEK
jgi:multiple sugar transport system permease protein